MQLLFVATFLALYLITVTWGMLQSHWTVQTGNQCWPWWNLMMIYLIIAWPSYNNLLSKWPIQCPMHIYGVLTDKARIVKFTSHHSLPIRHSGVRGLASSTNTIKWDDPKRVFVSVLIRLTKAYIKMSTDRMTQKHGSLTSEYDKQL